MENLEEAEVGNLKFACTNCGAFLVYKPGTEHLSCEYCGADNEIPKSDEEIEEFDYLAALDEQSGSVAMLSEQFVKCDSCGATSTVSGVLNSTSCAYCAAPLIIANAFMESIIEPRSLLPFKLTKDQGKEEFKKWVAKMWFAPNALKKASLSMDGLKGMYIPYWTYDSLTYTNYVGERGIHYYVTETYTANENGRSVTKTRQVRKTRWYPVSGMVMVNFDDVMVSATGSLPRKYVDELEPWDLENLVPFDKSYLSGFNAEKYQVSLKDGFEVAKEVMDGPIRSSIRNHIGGDEQRIISTRTNYTAITFKHLLCPVYTSAYRYKEKLYRFLINARTGEVQGERPYSAIKIALAILAALIVIAGLWYWYMQSNP